MARFDPRRAMMAQELSSHPYNRRALERGGPAYTPVTQPGEPGGNFRPPTVSPPPFVHEPTQPRPDPYSPALPTMPGGRRPGTPGGPPISQPIGPPGVGAPPPVKPPSQQPPGFTKPPARNPIPGPIMDGPVQPPGYVDNPFESMRRPGGRFRWGGP